MRQRTKNRNAQRAHKAISMAKGTDHPLRFLATRPEIPPQSAWEPILAEAYAANWFTNFGRLSRRLEAQLHSRWGAEEGCCVLVSSGTMAITAPLIARRIEGPVLLPAFTFPATWGAIKMAGAQPVLVDVSSDTWAIDAEQLDHAFRSTAAKACVLLAPFGLRTDFSAAIAVARSHCAIVVVDNAAGLGIQRQPIEADPAVFEAFSLHATKPFGIGEGGAVFAHGSQEAHLRAALNFGLPDFGASGGPIWGVNGKMSEMQAAIGLAVADTFAERLAARRALAQAYMEGLAQWPALRYPRDPNGSAWQVFPVLMPCEEAVVRAVECARAMGLELRRYYRPSLSTATEASQTCPVSEDLAARMLCLPVYSRFAEGEQRLLLQLALEGLAQGLTDTRNG
jgi:dTDP-4-amino-4,6-dideoxygalactose transaminase